MEKTFQIIKKILLKNGYILIHIRWTDHFSSNRDEFNHYIFGRHFDNNKYFLRSGFYTNRIPKPQFELIIRKYKLKIIKEKNIFIDFNSFKSSLVSDFEFKKEEINPFIRSTTYLIKHDVDE